MELKKRWLNKKHDLKEIGETPAFPKVIKLDISSMCNYQCLFCPQSKYGRTESRNIDHELALKIIKDAYDNGAREICLAMRGEPLLNSALEEYICYAKKIGYTYVFINTNGYLLDKDRGQRLLEAGIDSIKVSVNAADKSYYLIHGVDAYQRVKQNIIDFDYLRKSFSAPCRLFVSYVATKQTLKEAEIVKVDLKNYVDEIVVMNANSRGGGINEVEEKLYAGDDEYTFEYPCSQLFNTINVTAEGYMIICCQDFENLTVVSDLNHESIDEAWNGDIFRNFRHRYLNHDFKGTLCQNCLFHTNEDVVPLKKDVICFHVDKEKENELNQRILKLEEMAQ